MNKMYALKNLIFTATQGAEWFKAKVDIEVTQASQKAIEAIEKAGGTFTAAYYNRLGLRVLLKPEKFEDRPLPRRALPNNKLMAYYLDPKNKCVCVYMCVCVCVCMCVCVCVCCV